MNTIFQGLIATDLFVQISNHQYHIFVYTSFHHIFRHLIILIIPLHEK